MYYDGTKLLSMNDLEGNKPEIYMVTTNRTGGKTTYFGRLVMNRFIKRGLKFGLLYRYNYEIDNIGDKFFKDISGLFFPGYYMGSIRMAKGMFHILKLYEPGEDIEDKNAGTECGYAFSLNSADQIKKYSHMFSDIDSIIFDEFQSETNHYVPNEIEKFLSIHTSIARGQGKQYRYVPVYMISNPVSIINPYYVEMGISTRLQSNTKFLRGNGFVFEQGYNEGASNAQKESGFNKAFSKNRYVAYSEESVYLNDDKAFIEKPEGNGRYLATIRYGSTEFGIKEFVNSGILYCDDKPDKTYRYKIAVNTQSHGVNYVMLKRNDMFIHNMRYYFERGCFRFKDLRCKEALFKLISY